MSGVGGDVCVHGVNGAGEEVKRSQRLAVGVGVLERVSVGGVGESIFVWEACLGCVVSICVSIEIE